MPTFSLQCGPNADPNIRKVRNADPMPPLRTFLAALNPVCTGGGQICLPLYKFLNFLISLYKHMLILVDFSYMSITVLLQKTRAS